MIGTIFSRMSLLVQIKETLDSGDPLIRTWALVSGYYTPFVLCGSYLLLVTRIIPAVMKGRKPLHLRNLMVAYNLFIVLSYAGLLLSLFYFLLTTDCLKYVCREIIVEREHYTYKIITVCWMIYLLKYFEFADTIFFVLRKKDHLITHLHLVHHTALPILCWVLMRIETTGFQLLPGVLNSLVHIIMYAYYGLAAMGPQVQKFLWWKKYLTMIQITQFVIMLIYLLVIGPMMGCRTSKHGLAMVAVFVSLIFWLFFNFYNKTYVSKNPEHRVNGKIQNILDSPLCSSNGHIKNGARVGHERDS